MYIHGMRELANLHYHPMVRSADKDRSDQIRSSLAAPLTLAEVSSLGRQSLDGAELETGPGAWNSGPTVLDSLNDRVGLARGSWRETQRRHD